jgi:nucleotide-binding universal stress UspA family protein
LRKVNQSADKCQVSACVRLLLLRIKTGITLFNRILIPTDFSPAAWQAVQIGLEVGRRFGSDLYLLHVYPMTSRFDLDPNEPALPVQLEQMRTRMENLSTSLISNGDKPIHNVLLSGNIEDQLGNFLDDEKFDLVIMGVNSSGDDNKIGSHTLRLIEKTGVPVLIVPNHNGH